MFARMGGHIRHNVVAYLALFVALGGTSAWATHETILSSDIVDGEVKTVDLGAAAVTNAKLAAAAVSNPKLGPNAVSSTKVVDNNLQGADILDGTLTGADIGDREVTLGKIAIDGVGTLEVADFSLFTQDIAIDTLSSANLGEGAVRASELDANAVGQSELAAGAVTPAKFGTIPATRVGKTGDQSVPASTTPLLTFNQESFDFGVLHSNVTNNTRLTAPISGVYQASAGVRWNADSTGDRYLEINASNVGDVAVSATRSASTFSTRQAVSGLVRLAAGDFVEAAVSHTSGATQTVLSDSATFLAMHWVGPG